MLVAFSIPGILIIGTFVIFPLYVFIGALIAAKSLIAFLQIIVGIVFGGAVSSLFLYGYYDWAYNVYVLWRAKRYLADRQIRVNELTVSHFETMRPHLAKCIRLFIDQEDLASKNKWITDI